MECSVAASVVALHQYITAHGLTQSVAFHIAADGSIAGALIGSTGSVAAVIWTPVPEPASGALIAFGHCVTPIIRPRRR